MNLYELKTSDVIATLIDEVQGNHPDISKTKAKALILNALISNCVIEEIQNQIDFLIDRGGFPDVS